MPTNEVTHWGKRAPAIYDENHRTKYWKAIESLHNYYGLEVRADRAEMAYHHLTQIPTEAFISIIRQIQLTNDNMPRNIGKAFLEHYRAIERDFKKERVVQDCSYCYSTGYFSVEAKTNDRLPYSDRITFRCAACDNWRGILGTKIPAAYPLELKKHGKVILYNGPINDEEKEGSDGY